MTIYIPTPISEPPKEDGWYAAIKCSGKKVILIFQKGEWLEDIDYELCSVDTTFFTHYLRPVEGNVLTDEELEAVASKAWEAGYDFCNTDGWKQIEGVDAPDKDTYLKSIKK